MVAEYIRDTFNFQSSYLFLNIYYKCLIFRFFIPPYSLTLRGSQFGSQNGKRDTRGNINSRYEAAKQYWGIKGILY